MSTSREVHCIYIYICACTKRTVRKDGFFANLVAFVDAGDVVGDL